MPGSLSFGLDKNTDLVRVVTDLPTYKVVQTDAPIFDLSSNVVIGRLTGTKNITKDANGNVVLAVYNYLGTFLPATNVKGIFSFSTAYTADQLSANGETEQLGAYEGNIDLSVSSGVFSGQQGKTLKVKDSTDIRKYYVNYPYGYANVISHVQAPSALNTREFITLTSVDTPSWVIGSDPHELVCVEAGKWNILAQYQLISILGGLSTLNGWININGVDVPDSYAAGYASEVNEIYVLPIGFSQYFNVGDRVKFGILSTNQSSSTALELVVRTTDSPSGVSTPAAIITASRLY